MDAAVQVGELRIYHQCPSVEELLLKVLHFMKKYSGMFYLVITAKLQTAFDYFFFHCPCDAKSNCAYSLAFLLCPLIAILLWGGIKCCEKRSSDSCMTKCFIPGGWTLLFIFTWIATAFLNENFYLCIMSKGSTSNETAIADPANLPCLVEEENESPQSKRKNKIPFVLSFLIVAIHFLLAWLVACPMLCISPRWVRISFMPPLIAAKLLFISRAFVFMLCAFASIFCIICLIIPLRICVHLLHHLSHNFYYLFHLIHTLLRSLLPWMPPLPMFSERVDIIKPTR
uniref:Uncharacterized protein n=1 Tax=Eptatretus burgeri TaxID=7764 RepID=A0A8C4QDF6_EPTBU